MGLFDQNVGPIDLYVVGTCDVDVVCGRWTMENSKAKSPFDIPHLS
jgi:hypothetical protein